MDFVNELSPWFTEVSFIDQDEQPVVPYSAFYQIDDIGSGQSVRAETEITGLAETVTVRWEGSDTAILDESQPFETRRMTVRWTYLTQDSPAVELPGYAEYLLQVKNLMGATSTSPA